MCITQHTQRCKRLLTMEWEAPFYFKAQLLKNISPACNPFFWHRGRSCSAQKDSSVSCLLLQTLCILPDDLMPDLCC